MFRRLALITLAFALALPTVGSLGLIPGAPVVPATAAPGEVPDEVVVGFAGGIPAGAEAWIQAHGGAVLLREDVLGWVSAKLPDAAAAQRLLDAAVARDDVRFAQRDGYVQALFTPNDPNYGGQWGFPAIFAEQAWDLTLGTHAAKVAVLDTGIWGGHPDLQGNLCGPNASYVPGELPLVDGFGHGTHVAGTVAARTNNGIGVAGTSQSCLMDVKVLSRFGGGQWTWVAAGIRYAADNGADVISMSLGGGNPGQIMVDAVQYAYNTKGVLVVAAAGNSGCNVTVPTVPGGVGPLANEGSVIWPARYNEVLAVAATSPAEGVTTAGFSSCGADVEIAAPGEGVLSTFPPCSMALLCSNTLYGSISGTSMATPHVSGVAALVLSANPTIDAVSLRCVLNLSADDTVAAYDGAFLPARDYYSGWGKLNALKALTLAQTVAGGVGFAAFAGACTSGAAVLFN